MQGKARFVGCCNYPAWLFALSNAIAARNGWAQLVCNQVAYNIIERGVEVEILPQAVYENIAITAYRPLAQSLLTGKYRHGQALPTNSRGQSSAQIITWISQFGDSLEHYLRFAEALGVHPVQLAIAWTRYSAGVTNPIVGVSNISQLQTSLDAFSFDLSATQYEELTFLFNTEVKEEGLQRFPGMKYNFAHLRRNLHLLENNNLD